MENKKTLKEKLKSYSALAGSIIGIGASANAQVIYTDVSPDYTAVNDGDFYMLDLNNDAVVDFKFVNVKYTTSGNVYNYISVNMYGINAVAGPMSTVLPSSQIPMASALNLNAPINNTLPWNAANNDTAYVIPAFNVSIPSYNLYLNEGQWQNVPTDKYMPLRINISGINYYGWVRMTAQVDLNVSTFTIKDYAYQVLPNTEILAGQTVGIKELQKNNNLNVFAFNNIAYINFVNGTQPKNTKVVITDVLGKQIFEMQLNETKNEINLSEFGAGVYFITVQEDEFVTTEKITIQ